MSKVINFGSLNIDKVYQVDHIVKPGETIGSSDYNIWCGGKGANQSVALARAGAEVIHAGCVGDDGTMLTENLKKNNVNTEYIKLVDKPSGHAVIQVNKEGENSIILFPGANFAVTPEYVDSIIKLAAPGDVMLLQNEINLNSMIIEKAAEAGMTVCLNFAPFDLESAQKIPLEHISILIVNEHEAAGLAAVEDPEKALEALSEKYPDMLIVVTLGAKGAVCCQKGIRYQVPSPKIDAVDTTCAGDTFTGYFIESLLSGNPLDTCLENACKAASIAACRPGASNSIPACEEVY